MDSNVLLDFQSVGDHCIQMMFHQVQSRERAEQSRRQDVWGTRVRQSICIEDLGDQSIGTRILISDLPVATGVFRGSL